MVYPPGNRWVTLVLENADLTHAATTQPIRRVSRTVTLPKVYGRSTLGKLMRQVRADLIRHVGGRPSATQTLQPVALKLQDERFSGLEVYRLIGSPS